MSNEALTADSPLTVPVVGGDPTEFVDRRSPQAGGTLGRERRQFANNYDELSPDAAELARAIDEYKLHNRRRFISYEEMLTVVKSLGYRR